MGEIIEDVVLTPIPSNRGLSNFSADTINGRIWSKIENKFLASTPNDNGYVYNWVRFDNGEGKNYGVHRLIMSSYSGIPIEYFCRGKIEVNHVIEHEKWNNRIENLQISDRRGQYTPSVRAKMGKGKRLKEEQVIALLKHLKEWKENESNKLSTFIWMYVEKYGQGYRNIWNIVTGKSWKKLHNQIVKN